MLSIKYTIMKHLLTIDVEEWYDGLPIAGASCPSRIDAQVRGLLALLAESNTTATFFWLGCRVKRNKELIREVMTHGHEIACHGWTHDFLCTQRPDNLRSDLARAKICLEDAIGREISGFRAPYFSIDQRSLWILDQLSELGFAYDSSIHPVHYWRYGFASFPARPTILTTPSGEILELPISVRNIWGVQMPYAGGAYFRMLNYNTVARSIQIAEAKGEQVVFYLHPWELDPDHPRAFIPSTTQISHYWRLGSTGSKLRQLLLDFEFASISSAVRHHVSPVEPIRPDRFHLSSIRT